MSYLISIVGPTAVGKSALAHMLAKTWNTHIISCDARQIYRHMDIGTDKVSHDLRNEVPYHFIDILKPDETYTAATFESEVESLLKELFVTDDIVIAVGGSTLYMDAIWHGFDFMPDIPIHIRQELREEFEEEGLSNLLRELAEVDPVTYDQIDRQNHARVLRALEVHRSSGEPISAFRKGRRLKNAPHTFLNIGLQKNRAELYQHINQRVDEMMLAGLEREVSQLLDMGYTSDLQAMRSIGYQEMIMYLKGAISKEETVASIKQHSRRYAKRQLTYFRKFDHIRWFEAHDKHSILHWLEEKMGKK